MSPHFKKEMYLYALLPWIKSKFPISKRLFDFWYRLLENVTMWSLASMVPYFKLTSDPLVERWVNVSFLFLVSLVFYTVMWFLADNEAWMNRKEEL